MTGTTSAGGTGIAEAKRISPSSGVHAQPGGNGSTNGCQSASKACISDAKRTAPSRRAQYSGLMPTGSRAATKRPSRPAMTNANMPLSSPSPSVPRSSIRCSATSLSEVVSSSRSTRPARTSSWL